MVVVPFEREKKIQLRESKSKLIRQMRNHSFTRRRHLLDSVYLTKKKILIDTLFFLSNNQYTPPYGVRDILVIFISIRCEH